MAPPFGKQPRPKQVEGIHHRLVGPGAYLALRGLVSFGIFLRFLIHGHEVDGLLVSATFLWLASFALAAAAYRTREKHRRTRIAQWTVSLDVVALCLFHRATGVVESDFYLFFVVPILTAAEYLSQRAVLATTGGAAVAFFAVVFATPTDLTDVRTQWYELLIRVFLPRALFFFGPTLLLALRIRQEQDVTVSATSETREAQSLLRSRHELDRLFEPPQVLQAVLEQAVRDQPGWRAVGILVRWTPSFGPSARRVKVEPAPV